MKIGPSHKGGGAFKSCLTLCVKPYVAHCQDLAFLCHLRLAYGTVPPMVCSVAWHLYPNRVRLGLKSRMPMSRNGISSICFPRAEYLDVSLIFIKGTRRPQKWSRYRIFAFGWKSFPGIPLTWGTYFRTNWVHWTHLKCAF